MLSQRLDSLQQLSRRLMNAEGGIINESEGKLLKTIQQGGEVKEEVEGKRGILDVVKGFLPRRKEKKAESQEAPPTPTAKKVTPIQYRKKKS
jgi:hypothetical protein